MGRRRRTKAKENSTDQTPPSSSSSSSEFEFTISLSPSSRKPPHNLCPADELFYKGQLLPLHLSPRISMVRTLLLASSSTSSTDSAAMTASRDSNGSSSSAPELSDSSRPSSVTEEEAMHAITSIPLPIKRGKYFQSFAKRINSSAKQVIKKYVNKVKPLYEKLSKNQNVQEPGQSSKKTFSFSIRRQRDRKKEEEEEEAVERSDYTHSFSGNLKFPRRKRCAGSCPSSMRSSPTHSGLLSVRNGKLVSSSSSSMEELQSAIQGAIAHCKSTMVVQSNQGKGDSLTVVG